jgi:hypothetical protein
MILLVTAVIVNKPILIMGNTISNWWVPTVHGVSGQGYRVTTSQVNVTNTRRENSVTKAPPALIAAGWEKLDRPAQPQVGETSDRGAEEEKSCCELPSTTMTEDGCTAMNMFSSMGTMDLLRSQETSIEDFMSKPFFAADVSWTTSLAANTIITGSQINVNDLITSLNSYFKNKVQGFALYRGTIVCHVKINAMPFQQGRLLLHFLPNYVQRVAADSSFGPMHNASLTTKSMQPGIELDCRDTECVLEIPYVAPTNWCKAVQPTEGATSEYYDWGTFFLSVLSPLMATGDAGVVEVDTSIYFYFKNFELVGPTVPQAGGGAKLKKFKNASVNRESATVSEHGAVTTALSLASQAASALSSIPMISAVTEPLSWALRVASGVASVFGWSKPPNNSSTGYISRAFNKYAATSDGDDPSFTLGLLHDNAVLMTDINSVRPEDEMSSRFLYGVEAYIGTTTSPWTLTTTSGTSLFTLPISPSNMNVSGSLTYGTTPAHTATYSMGPPFWYLSNFFTYWRGSIKLKFKVIKTDFHSGRLQLTYTPIGYGTVQHPTLATANIALREIIDIRTGNEFEFTLPWYCATNYLPIAQAAGQIDLLVLNELKGPASVSSTVNILVYASAGDDFELAGPGSNFTSGTGNTIAYPFSPQSGEELIVSEKVGGQGTSKNSMVHCLHSMGELFASVKQLLNRQHVIRMTTQPTGSGYTIWPWFSSVISLNGTTGVIVSPPNGGDMYSVIAPMYAFYKGSMRVGIKTPASYPLSICGSVNPTYTSYTTNVAVLAAAAWDNAATGSVTWNASSVTYAPSMNAGVAVSDNGIGGALFRVPYYCQTKSSMVIVHSTATANVPPDISQPTTILNMYVPGSTFGNNVANGITRACADDFQFSYFIGCPPLLTNWQ